MFDFYNDWKGYIGIEFHEMKKARHTSEAINLENIPNIGLSIANDLRGIGVALPIDLKSKDPYKLYVKLCKETKKYHDPCVLDVFISAVYFMNGSKPKPWWAYTKERKKNFFRVDNGVLEWRKK